MSAERNQHSPSGYEELQVAFILHPVRLLKVCNYNCINISRLLTLQNLQTSRNVRKTHDNHKED